MTTFTARQREVLKKRLALALCWKSVSGAQRSNANDDAECVIAAIEDMDFSGMAQRRAVQSIVRRLEETEARSA